MLSCAFSMSQGCKTSSPGLVIGHPMVHYKMSWISPMAIYQAAMVLLSSPHGPSPCAFTMSYGHTSSSHALFTYVFDQSHGHILSGHGTLSFIPWSILTCYHVLSAFPMAIQQAPLAYLLVIPWSILTYLGSVPWPYNKWPWYT
jgi:hypothetical protein